MLERLSPKLRSRAVMMPNTPRVRHERIERRQPKPKAPWCQLSSRSLVPFQESCRRIRLTNPEFRLDARKVDCGDIQPRMLKIDDPFE